jgi:hypothetical protein
LSKVHKINQNKEDQTLNASNFVQDDEEDCCKEFKEYSHLNKDKSNLIKFTSLECGCKNTLQFYPNPAMVADGTDFGIIPKTCKKLERNKKQVPF